MLDAAMNGFCEEWVNQSMLFLMFASSIYLPPLMPLVPLCLLYET